MEAVRWRGRGGGGLFSEGGVSPGRSKNGLVGAAPLVTLLAVASFLERSRSHVVSAMSFIPSIFARPAGSSGPPMSRCGSAITVD